MSHPVEIVEKLDRIATLLNRHRTTPATWTHGGTPEAHVRKIIRLYQTDEPAFWRALNSHAFWGGIGSVANQALNASPGVPQTLWHDEIRELRGLLIELGEALMDNGTENPDITYWLAAFHHWNQSEV